MSDVRDAIAGEEWGCPMIDIVSWKAFPPGYPPSLISRQLDLEYFFLCTLRNTGTATAHRISTMASHGHMGRAYRDHGTLAPGGSIEGVGMLVDDDRVVVLYESAKGQRYESCRRVGMLDDNDMDLGTLEVGIPS